MDFRFSILIMLLAITKKSTQNCISLNVFRLYYTSVLNMEAKNILCQNEILSSNFHGNVEPVVKGARIQWLQINNTQSPEIAAGAFNTLRLSELRINGAGVQVIQPGAFEGLSLLNKLSLKNNTINELKDHYFVNITHLSELDLSFNNIGSIDDNSFAHLNYLYQLILQHNFLTKLPLNVFKDLNSLLVLDLSFNKLTSIEKNIFANLSRLKILFLNNNNLKVFDDILLSNNKNIQDLYINNNNLMRINSLSLNSSLRMVNASYNLIRSLSFSTYTHIEVVDLSSSGITSTKNFSFKNLSVSELYLDRNYLGLNPIDNKIFTNLTSMTVISLSDNQIRQLNPDVFENNALIKKINLNKNYLYSISIRGFPISVQDLFINHNNIDSKVNVTNLINLRWLDISFNNLTEITFDFLKGLRLIMRLNLSNNKIIKISLGSFRDLKMLRDLDLSNNQISDLPIGMFVGLDVLNNLDVSYNKLTTLTDGVFHNLRYLTTLNLAFNNLSYSSVQNALTHLYIVREVGLAGNGWSCHLMSSILKEYKRIKIKSAANFDVTNVDGVACEHEVTDYSKDVNNTETTYLTAINSKLCTTNAVLILILIFLVIKTVVKHVSWFFAKDKLRIKQQGRKSEEELQLVNDS